jgi:hypothetical protein
MAEARESDSNLIGDCGRADVPDDYNKKTTPARTGVAAGIPAPKATVLWETWRSRLGGVRGPATSEIIRKTTPAI